MNPKKDTRSQKRKILIPIAFAAAGIILLSCIMGSIYEWYGYSQAKNNYPSNGQMIKIGDRSIHTVIRGEKTDLPAIVIESGAGQWSYDWKNIQVELSKYTQVLTYDRAGYGYSDSPEDGFSVDSTIQDLYTVLEKTEIKGPILLIGHSAGGIYTRHFAERYPEKVAGMVLVDARNEFFAEQAEAYNDVFFETQDQTMNGLLARIGLVRLLGEKMFSDKAPEFLSPAKYVQVHWDVPFFSVMNEEIKQMNILERRLAETIPLRDKPLAVITPEKPDMQAKAMGFTELEGKKLEEKWLEAQQNLTSLSNNSELIKISDSSHSIMHDQPEMLVAAILSVAEKIKN
ncbi:alpha/beta fold hydrolase [Metabacillus indicus]|uniref:alpha/beta hydrolase n=1 Tax=Metabacillus indicus TaxID=246786 RepID=UPI0039840F5C